MKKVIYPKLRPECHILNLRPESSGSGFTAFRVIDSRRNFRWKPPWSFQHKFAIFTKDQLKKKASGMEFKEKAKMKRSKTIRVISRRNLNQ